MRYPTGGISETQQEPETHLLTGHQVTFGNQIWLQLQNIQTYRIQLNCHLKKVKVVSSPSYIYILKAT